MEHVKLLFLLLLLLLSLVLVVMVVIITHRHHHCYHTHTHKLIRMAISKATISHIFSTLKPCVCSPYRANSCKADTVFDSAQITKIEIKGFGINGSSNFHLEVFLTLSEYQPLRNDGDCYQSTVRHIAENLKHWKLSCDKCK
jgi:hypothetical protein